MSVRSNITPISRETGPVSRRVYIFLKLRNNTVLFGTFTSEFRIVIKESVKGVNILLGTNRHIDTKNANRTGFNLLSEYITVKYIYSRVFFLTEYAVIK